LRRSRRTVGLRLKRTGVRRRAVQKYLTISDRIRANFSHSGAAERERLDSGFEKCLNSRGWFAHKSLPGGIDGGGSLLFRHGWHSREG